MRFHLGKTKISKIIHKLTLFIVHKERTKPLKKTISKKIPQTKYMFQHLYIITCISLIHTKYLKFNDLHHILSKLVIHE